MRRIEIGVVRLGGVPGGPGGERKRVEEDVRAAIDEQPTGMAEV